MSKIESINKVFKCPIYYNDKKQELQQNIINDLELVENIDISASGSSIYEYAFNPSSCFSKKLIEQLPLYYTTDTDYLKETQTLLKTYEPLESNDNYCEIKSLNDDGFKKPNYDEIMNTWDEIKGDTGFREKYYYIDWPSWDFLNNSDGFLQFMSMYNLSSPIFSLIVPILILIFPFFIIKMRGLPVTFSEYVEILKIIAANHAIGRIFTHFNSVSTDQKIYILISAAFYVFSIYQNILTCIRFYNNMKKIHKYLDNMKIYINHSINQMKHFLKYSNSLNKYSLFNSEVERNIAILEEYKSTFNFNREFSLSFSMTMEIGRVLKCFYQLYNNEIYNNSILYSFGFNGYIESILGVVDNIKNKHMNYAEFTNDKKKNTFKKAYYAALKDKNPICNDLKMKKNIIITGPNASGKTTILKSTLINILLSQQFGCGFYESAKLKPFKHVHCYLNIPDTSGRDSLFQAEARRCKQILDIIKNTKDETHFCLFDELYSGTNPEEAEVSATAFMEYLSKFKNVTSMLTTHFIKVCKKLKKNKAFENNYMSTEYVEKTDSLKYTYLLKKGLSEVKGGIRVLKEMEYPKELLDKIKNHN